MDQIKINDIKAAYIEDLMRREDMESAAAIAKKPLYSPVFFHQDVHPEEEPSLQRINQAIDEIGLDLAILDREVIGAANHFVSLMENAKSKLVAIDQNLQIEKERLQDVNMLCNQYQGFNTVIMLSPNHFAGNFSYDDHVMLQGISDIKTVALTPISVFGNGFAGNRYVWSDNQYVAEAMRTENLTYMVDNSAITAYEYTRITIDQKGESYPQDINVDTNEAECSIVLKGTDAFNLLKITSDSPSIVLTSAATSTDGIVFTTVWEQDIEIMNPDRRYDTNADYIYGSGILAAPPTIYIKLSFRSNGVTNEALAYEAIEIAEGQVVKKHTLLPAAKRHVIRINNVAAKMASYNDKSNLATKELISKPVESIAIFSNEYIPPHLPQNDYSKYILTINGKDYDIVPINSQKDGIKIIKLSNYDFHDLSIQRINESIKSAVLTIVLNAYGQKETTFLSNVKVCLGKGV